MDPRPAGVPSFDAFLFKSMGLLFFSKRQYDFPFKYHLDVTGGNTFDENPL
jgi:hypothetical protein